MTEREALKLLVDVTVFGFAADESFVHLNNTAKLVHVPRDVGALKRLKLAGWRALVVWECELKNEGQLARKIRRFLG